MSSKLISREKTSSNAQLWNCIVETWGVFTLGDIREKICEFLELAES